MKNLTQRAFMLITMVSFMLSLRQLTYAFPTPTTNYKNLNIIETVQVDHQMTTAEGAWAAFNITSLIEKTGVTYEEAAANIGKIMNFWQYDHSESAEDYYVADELWPMETWGYWWFNFADDEKTTFVADQWSEGCWGWTGSGVTLGTDSVCWIFIGPYTTSEVGQKVHSQLYAVIGSDAIQFNIDAEVIGQPMRKLDECTLRGETTIYTNNQVSNGWNGRPVRWNVQEALDSLGCGLVDIHFMMLDADSCLNPNYTATSGFWIDMDGKLTDYVQDTKTWFVEYNSSTGALNVGHMPNMFTGDGTEVCEGTVYLCFYDNIYKVNVVMDVIPNREAPTEFIEKGREELYLQGLANHNDWSVGYNVQIDYQRATELTECGRGDDLVLYAKYPDGRWTKETSTTVPYGFWLTNEGKFCWYGNEGYSYFFENVNGGLIGNWGHIPGADDPGTSYRGEFYYVNEANGYYYTVDYLIDFVSEVVENAVVGEDSITVFVSDEGYVTPLDVTPALAALGIEETEIPEEAQWLVPSFATLYAPTNDTGEGYVYDAEGKTCNMDTEEAENAVYKLYYHPEEAGFYGEAWKEFTDETRYNVRQALAYSGMYYIFHITVAPASVADNIEEVTTSVSNNDGNIYNLNGQKVDNSYRGIVIKNGKVILQK